MSKKKKNKDNRESTIENYYDLKIDKVDELVAALKGTDSPEEREEISLKITDCTGQTEEGTNTKKRKKEKEFDPYKVDKLSRIPAWLKAIFIKFWFAGAVCYFIMMGTGLQDFDAIIVTGVVLGVIVDILVNPCFGYMQSDKREYDIYIMLPFPFKKFWTFFVNIIYYVGVLLVVNYCYLGINLMCNAIAGTTLKYYLGVEPLMFGVLTTIVDMAFIGIKDLIVYLVRRAKRKKAESLELTENTEGSKEEENNV